ncbi:penicillin-binding protein [Intrasporangium chromatireducens Q5-1]|uniref:Penicillin-binding protein n=1 Tax=Intrasporangium chromatireducens Q5-1 TaxID=584657 RepID=W9GJI1_9MICO|nr:serine hydrolase domain-containing protein [Intrasporangium chromatireducens]EWT04978.1 penicillin-binding protein [Intrasporangium chromatireducens Q5-1]
MATWDEVAGALAGLGEENHFTGSVLVVEGERTLLEVCAGLANRATATPIHPDTRFGLASLSKPFTAAAVLSCVRDGLLGIPDRVADLLPARRRPRSLSDQVTVHHLLTHTSGIGDYAEEDQDLPGYVEDYGALWGQVPMYRIERPDDLLPLYADAPPVAPPGTEFHYNNAGFVLLGAIVEQVTGQHFTSAVTERVLGPAGMASAGYFRSDEPVPDVAVGYQRHPGDPAGARSNIFSIPVVGNGDGGAHATPRDLDRFLRSIASGDLLGDGLSTQMRTHQVDVAGGVSYGYGLYLRADGGFGHGGGDPGVETMARHIPDRDLTLVALCNGEEMLKHVWPLLVSAI